VLAHWEASPTFFGTPPREQPAAEALEAREAFAKYTTAKIVLLGDSGVGKTSLGWRLKHGNFQAHESTHGAQFWLLDGLSERRADGTQCDAILWDFAGQADYRLVHQVSIVDADLALIVFDASERDNPLKAVDFWLKSLRAQRSGYENSCPVILVSARA